MLLGPGSPAGIRDPVTWEKGEESLREKLRRMSSPRHWDVALVLPRGLCPPPATAETGLACPVQWAFPPSLHILESRATKFQVLAFTEAGDTVTADHCCKWLPWQPSISPLCWASLATCPFQQSGMRNSYVTEFACLVPIADNGRYTYALSSSIRFRVERRHGVGPLVRKQISNPCPAEPLH